MQNMPKLTGGNVEDTSGRSSFCWVSFRDCVGINMGHCTKESQLFKSVAPAMAIGCYFKIRPEVQLNPYQVVVYTWGTGNRYGVGVIDEANGRGLSSSVARRYGMDTYKDSELLEVPRQVEGLLSESDFDG